MDDAKVEAVNRIFDGEILRASTIPRPAASLWIAHRLHENDLSAHLKGAAKTKHIVLPLVPVRRTPIKLSTGFWVREKGELLRKDPTPKPPLKSSTSTPTHLSSFSISKASLG